MDDLYHPRILELAANIPHVGRLAEPDGASTKVSREDFIQQYRGTELDPNWLKRVAKLATKGTGRNWNTVLKLAEAVAGAQ